MDVLYELLNCGQSKGPLIIKQIEELGKIQTLIDKNVLKGYVYGDMINKCRDLVNTPYNYLNAIDLAEYAKKLEEKRLKEMGSSYEEISMAVFDSIDLMNDTVKHLLDFKKMIAETEGSVQTRDLEKICKECENKGGVNRFTTDVNDIIVYCKDGSMNRLK